MAGLLKLFLNILPPPQLSYFLLSFIFLLPSSSFIYFPTSFSLLFSEVVFFSVKVINFFFLVSFESLMRAMDSLLRKCPYVHAFIFCMKFQWNVRSPAEIIYFIFYKPLKRHKQRALDLKGRRDHNISKSRKVL